MLFLSPCLKIPFSLADLNLLWMITVTWRHSVASSVLNSPEEKWQSYSKDEDSMWVTSSELSTSHMYSLIFKFWKKFWSEY